MPFLRSFIRYLFFFYLIPQKVLFFYWFFAFVLYFFRFYTVIFIFRTFSIIGFCLVISFSDSKSILILELFWCFLDGKLMISLRSNLTLNIWMPFLGLKVLRGQRCDILIIRIILFLHLRWRIAWVINWLLINLLFIFIALIIVEGWIILIELGLFIYLLSMVIAFFHLVIYWILFKLRLWHFILLLTL